MIECVCCAMPAAPAEPLAAFARAPGKYYLAPAFFDLQVNGFAGVSFDGPAGVTAAKLARVADALRERGCGAFVPTLISSPAEVIASSLEAVRAFMRERPGAIPGLHIEGPYISAAKRGIHPPALLRDLAGEELELILSYRDAVAYITADPRRIAPADLRRLRDAGIRISLGHTDASGAEAAAFLANGASLATHLYNAMSLAANGRTPGAVEAVYNDPDVYCGVIADGLHVDFALVKLAGKILGDRFVLVTDCLSAAGTDPAVFKKFAFAGKEIFNDPEKGCRDAAGTLAGSRLTMAEGVRNLVKYCGFSVERAVRAAAVAPAAALGLGPLPGRVVLDGDLRLAAVIP